MKIYYKINFNKIEIYNLEKLRVYFFFHFYILYMYTIDLFRHKNSKNLTRIFIQTAHTRLSYLKREITMYNVMRRWEEAHENLDEVFPPIYT